MHTLKNTLLLLAILSAFSVQSQIYSYNPDVTFTIKKVSRWNKINTGTSLYIPEKECKFFMVVIDIENHSAEKQLVEFDTFFLLDYMMSVTYKTEFVMSIGGVTRFYDMHKKLPKKSKTKLNVVMVCPEHFIPEILLVREQRIPIPEKRLNFKI